MEGKSFFSVDKDGPTLCFRCGRHDIAHDGGSDRDRSIFDHGWTDICGVAEIEVPSFLALCFGL